MEYSVKREYKSDSLYSKTFETDQPLNTSIILNILRNYENDSTRLYECHCSTFSEAGNPLNRTFHSSQELVEGINQFSNPSVSFRAIYVDSMTNKYKFDVSTDVNTNLIKYSVSSKLADIVNREIELASMTEDKKSDGLGDNKTFQL